MESTHRPLDPLSQAKQNKEKKKAEEKGKHKSVSLSTINRGPINNAGGINFSTTEGEEADKIVKRKKNAGKGLFTGFFSKGAVGVGRVDLPEETTIRSESQEDQG